MKINYLTQNLVRKDYLCSIFGHKYILTKKVNEHFSEYECENCKIQVTNDSRGQKINLTEQLKDINNTLFYLHLKKEFLARFYFGKKNKA